MEAIRGPNQLKLMDARKLWREIRKSYLRHRHADLQHHYIRNILMTASQHFFSEVILFAKAKHDSIHLLLPLPKFPSHLHIYQKSLFIYHVARKHFNIFLPIQ